MSEKPHHDNDDDKDDVPDDKHVTPKKPKKNKNKKKGKGGGDGEGSKDLVVSSSSSSSHNEGDKKIADHQHTVEQMENIITRLQSGGITSKPAKSDKVEDHIFWKTQPVPQSGIKTE